MSQNNPAKKPTPRDRLAGLNERNRRINPDRLNQFAEAFRRAGEDIERFFAGLGLTPPRGIEDWEHVARIAGFPLELIRDGDWSPAEAEAELRAWIDRQRLTARINAAEFDAGKPPDEAGANEGKTNVGETGVGGGVDAEAYLPPARLAELFGINPEALRSRLNRWRSRHDGGWIENPDRAPRAAKYLYSATTVRPICESLRATSQRPATKNKSARSKD